MPKRTGVFGIIDPLWMNHVGERTPELQLSELVYSTVIQSGLDAIHLVASPTSVPDSPLLTGRITSELGGDWAKCLGVVEAFFQNQIPNFNAGDAAPLEIFLTDVLFALEKGHPLLTASRIPRLDDQSCGSLPPSILIPCATLLAAVRSIDPMAAIPASVLSREDAARFEELLASRLFAAAVSSHRQLDDSTIAAESAQRAIASAARELCDRNKRLRQGKVGASLISFSARFVDRIFGQFTGGLGEHIATAAESWVASKQRLVVYELRPMVDSIMLARARFIADAEPPEYLRSGHQ
jgi:hypothetical protein